VPLLQRGTKSDDRRHSDRKEKDQIVISADRTKTVVKKCFSACISTRLVSNRTLHILKFRRDKYIGRVHWREQYIGRVRKRGTIYIGLLEKGEQYIGQD
jgi:hypothetical protein